MKHSTGYAPDISPADGTGSTVLDKGDQGRQKHSGGLDPVASTNHPGDGCGQSLTVKVVRQRRRPAARFAQVGGQWKNLDGNHHRTSLECQRLPRRPRHRCGFLQAGADVGRHRPRDRRGPGDRPGRLVARLGPGRRRTSTPGRLTGCRPRDQVRRPEPRAGNYAFFTGARSGTSASRSRRWPPTAPVSSPNTPAPALSLPAP